MDDINRDFGLFSSGAKNLVDTRRFLNAIGATRPFHSLAPHCVRSSAGVVKGDKSSDFLKSRACSDDFYKMKRNLIARDTKKKFPERTGQNVLGANFGGGSSLFRRVPLGKTKQLFDFWED